MTSTHPATPPSLTSDTHWTWSPISSKEISDAKAGKISTNQVNRLKRWFTNKREKRWSSMLNNISKSMTKLQYSTPCWIKQYPHSEKIGETSKHQKNSSQFQPRRMKRRSNKSTIFSLISSKFWEETEPWGFSRSHGKLWRMHCSATSVKQTMTR